MISICFSGMPKSSELPRIDHLPLSFERAKAVLEYFAEFGGLNKAYFEIFGMGDKFPVGNNNTEIGRKQNRRIEIIKVE